MTKSIAASLCLVLASGCGPTDRTQFALAPGDLWIRDVTVVSMERDAPRVAHVVVRGGRIAWVGPAPAAADSAVTVLDGTGRFLVPGLIDGHVHLGAPPPGMTARLRAARPEIERDFNDQLPRSYLYFGFTTVVEMGVTDSASLGRVAAAADGLAPTIVSCGRALVVADGYPMRLLDDSVRYARFPNVLADPQHPDHLPAGSDPGEHTPAAAVERVRAVSGRCVKAFYELGDPDDPWPVPTVAMMREAADAAQRADLPLLLHANSLAAHQFAVATRPSAVAHGLWFWPGILDEEQRADTLPQAIRDVLDAERKAGVGYMPTLRVIDGLVDLRDTLFLASPNLARAVPPALVAWYRSAESRAVADESNPGGSTQETLEAASRLGARALAYSSARGARVHFGSDSPSGSAYTNPPGLNGHLELRAMEAAGLSPREVLMAATLANARLFRLGREVGTVEVGKVADLLLLDADPLASTSAFDAIHTVILRGRPVTRSALSAARVPRP